MTSATAEGLTDVELFAKGAHHDLFTRLRGQDPVHWHEHPAGGGFWNVTRYEDVVAVSKDPATFSSEHELILDNHRPAAARPGEAYGGADGRGRMMIDTDPPRHAHLRRMVNKGFTPRAIQRLREPMQRIADAVIDSALARADACDFVEDVARPLPRAIMGGLLGMPEDEWPALARFADTALGADDPDVRADALTDERGAIMPRIQDAFEQVAQDRRSTPREGDLASQIVHGTAEGEPLTDLEVRQFFVLLVIAGIETTRNATTGGMLSLLDHPDQHARLEADPSLVPNATEEMLRYRSPGMHFMRVATRDTKLRGRHIRAGDRVVMWYVSANRDEAVFGDDAQHFRIDRTPNEHLAFGIGEHFCLGASLARLELQVLFESIVTRTRGWELAGRPDVLRSNFIAGIKRLPVRFRSASPGGRR